jgi:hypothetical protein
MNEDYNRAPVERGVRCNEVKMLHIYRTNVQPATDWMDMNSSEPIQMSWPPETLLWCCCCGKQHPASGCVVYSYYDGPMIYCADWHGCKDPQVIAEKRSREFRNRSVGQKARWAKASNA